MQTEQLLHRRDLIFWLFELGATEHILSQPPFDDYSRDDVEAMIDAVTDFAAAEFDGMAELLDANEPRLEDGTVWNHPALKPAIDRYLETGFFTAGFDPQWGGMGLPYAVSQVLEVPTGAHAGTGLGYLFLTAAAANMLNVVGTDEQKARYLPKMVSGEWFGTMMLSEPQAGSSVGDIRTRAVLQPDGSYQITGSKMWISGGDHELADNIVHMVLAKIENEDGSLTPGSRGVSLFLVPKFRVNDDGSPGAHNGIRLAGLNHKMGQRGIVNTVPVLGDDAPCVGELLGAPGKGLAGMFHMMNEARIGIGVSAAQLAWNGYRYSLDYAKDRTQGRSLTAPGADQPQIPIIEHTDVKRMLLHQKAIAEGAMALCLYGAELIDLTRITHDADKRQQIEALLALLTPVIKSWPSMHGLEANHLAIQVLGGYGYTRDYPVERIYRDNRLNEIHEGTTGIQSLDLLGRKVLQDNGQSLGVLLGEISKTIAASKSEERLGEFASDLELACEQLQKVTGTLAATAVEGLLPLAMANSVVYMDMVGQIVVAWMWLRMAQVACAAPQDASAADAAFYQGKLAACQFFFRHELSKTQSQARLLASLDDSSLKMTADQF